MLKRIRVAEELDMHCNLSSQKKHCASGGIIQGEGHPVGMEVKASRDAKVPCGGIYVAAYLDGRV